METVPDYFEDNFKNIIFARQACKLKFRLRDLISCFCGIQTGKAALNADAAKAAAEHKQEVSSLNLNFSLQACLSVVYQILK